MRILTLHNAPWAPSGYGEQMAMLIPRLVERGHDVAVAANHGLQGTIAPWGDLQIPVFPAIHKNHDIGHYAEFFGADIVLSLLDTWTLRPDLWPDDLRVAAWTPIDHFPPPPLVLAVLKHERVEPIAMSRNGERWMEMGKLDPMYAPHAVDTTVFRPIPEVRDAVRDGMGIPRDAFLVGMVGANRGWSPMVCRKSFPQAIQAFAHFLGFHDDAWLYLHTESVPKGGAGTNLEPIIMALNEAAPNIKLIDRIRFPSEKELLFGLTRDQLAQQYNAFDVLLNPSMGEGFGVPILEAQACGIPVICSDHSAMTELTHSGWLVSGDPWWDEPQTSFAFMPHLDSIVEALEQAWLRRADREMREAAVDFAMGYDADRVATTYWDPILERLARPREVPPLTPATQNGNRAMRRAAARAKAKA